MTKRELADPSCLVFRVALAGNQGSSAYVTLADKSRLLIRDNTMPSETLGNLKLSNTDD